MDVRTDDDLYRVDRTYLGPKGRSLLIHATYRQWGLFFVVAVILLVCARALDLPVNPMTLLCGVTAAWFIALGISKRLTYDRPLFAEMVRLGQELIAPRPNLNPQPETHKVVVSVPVWTYGARPNPRWWARLGHALASSWLALGQRVTGRRKGRIYEDGRWRHV